MTFRHRLHHMNGDDAEGDGSKADEHVGAQTGRVLVKLPLQTDQAAQDDRAKHAHQQYLEGDGNIHGKFFCKALGHVMSPPDIYSH
ncbi:hypothetical protein D3C78_1039580 [compost metagenome]